MTSLAYWAVFTCGWLGCRDERDGAGTRLWPLNLWAVATWAVVAVPTMLQVTVWPGLFQAGMRRAASVEDGQVWRVVTSMTLQDGWTAGAVFNLSILAVTVVLAGPVLAGWRFPAVFVAGGVLANLATILTHGPDGAGSSMATMVTVVVGCLLVRGASRPPGQGGSPVLRWLPVAGIAVAATVLVVGADEHGWAVVIGLVLGAALIGTVRSHPIATADGDP